MWRKGTYNALGYTEPSMQFLLIINMNKLRCYIHVFVCIHASGNEWFSLTSHEVGFCLHGDNSQVPPAGTKTNPTVLALEMDGLPHLKLLQSNKLYYNLINVLQPNKLDYKLIKGEDNLKS